MKFAVVVVGYNRPFGLKRLTLSLKEADYLSDKVDLVISIDKGKKQQEIIDICEKIKWDFGEKHIRIFNENLGLRKHIIKCGDLTNLYDAVVVLEDDITVSKYFYNRQLKDTEIMKKLQEYHCINMVFIQKVLDHLNQ